MNTNKAVVLTIFTLLFAGVVVLGTQLKNAYKVLPIKESPQMEIDPFGGWREFNAQSGHFRVLFPMPPQYAKEANLIPGTDKKRLYEMYVSEKMDGAILMINLITYPPEVDTSDVSRMLRDTVDEMVATNPQNELQNITDKSFQGHQAVNFNIVNHDFHVEGLAFLVDKKLYLLTYVAKKADFSEADYEHFIQSFQMTNPS